jgi:capsid protein
VSNLLPAKTHKLGLRARIALVGSALRAAFARSGETQDVYEAGRMWDPRRSRIPGWVRDARFDADAMTRLEIMRKARYFERNNGVVNRLADLYEEYVVGPTGLRFVPASSDREWNRRFSKWFKQWATMCEISSRISFGSAQALAARSEYIDGECFVILTRGKERQGGRSFPRIELMEAHRCETPPDLASDETVVDGIKRDEKGRPLVYYFRKSSGSFGSEDGKFDQVPAEMVVHVMEQSRIGQPRGLSHLYPILNDLHDLDDLQILGMDATKEAAQVTNVIKTKTGEVSAKELRSMRFNFGGVPASENPKGTSGGSSADRTEYYQQVFGGKARVLRKDDEFEQFVVTRPSESERAYWDALTSKVCAGGGISKLLVMPWSMQGTVVRADLDVQGQFFRSRSSVHASFWSQVYHYVAKWAVANVLELSDPPEDYLEHKVRAPRSVNVDVGRNSAALIAEYEAGIRTLESLCGELGEDWVEVLEQRGSEMAECKRIEREQGLQEGSLIKFTLEAAKLKMQADVQKQQAEFQQQQRSQQIERQAA